MTAISSNAVDSTRSVKPPSYEGSASPVEQGLGVIRELMQAADGVLFSILPQGLMFHAAIGEGSARLAAHLTSHAEVLAFRVQGPVVLGGHPDLEAHLQGPAWADSPVQNVCVLGERRNRERAFGLALKCHHGQMRASATKVRFAHTLFRDLAHSLLLPDRRAAEPHALKQRWQKFQFANLIGASESMRKLFRTIEKLADSDVNVLVLGESGTGKELVARAIHEGGPFHANKFVAQNCAALPEALLESELFGHCKGAFTGANYDKKGLFEEANGGTFFLDEIADMPKMLQIKMLRVLQDGEIRRLGETKTRSVTVRIVAATNKPLSQEVARGAFREDLYHRLNVVRLELPPLRQRREDITLLARYFCDRVSQRLQRNPMHFTQDVLRRFVEYEWPGNVRELENEVERLVALHGHEEEIRAFMLSERLRYGSSVDWSLGKLEEIQDLHQATEYLERALISRSLDRNDWNKSRAASELGVSRQGLIKKIKRLQLVRPRANTTPEDDLQSQLDFPEDTDAATTAQSA